MNLLSTRKDNLSQHKSPSLPTPRRKVSDDAANFAQNILDLEERCQRLSSEVASWENQCNVMGIENKSLRDALRQTDARLQYFERRTTQLETKLQTAVKIVADCLEDGVVPYRASGSEQQQQKSGDENSLPRVIADGPRTDPVTTN
jgi:regulator of replication initiation timing